MLWLEMTRDPEHGGGSWGFALSLWSPAYKETSVSNSIQKWAYWETLLRVKAGDLVVHLKGKRPTTAFVGFSTTETDGFETHERPPNPKQWSYADRFYRVLLKDFTTFPEHILLSKVFADKEKELREYLIHNNKTSF